MKGFFVVRTADTSIEEHSMKRERMPYNPDLSFAWLKETKTLGKETGDYVGTTGCVNLLAYLLSVGALFFVFVRDHELEQRQRRRKGGEREMIYIVISLIVYVVMMAAFSYIGFKRTRSTSDFLLAGKKIHPIVMALSYGATFISTSAIVGFGGAAGQFGMGLLWLTSLNIIVGVFIAFVVFGKKTREIGHRLGTNTMPEFFARRFQSGFMQSYAAVLIFLFMPIYASAVLKGIVDYVSNLSERISTSCSSW
jgi:hypothetical protein